MTASPAPTAKQDDVKERVRDALDIVDVVGSYLSLRRAGRNLVGLCPWHDDSRPSLQVNPERQTFRCWVCNIGGDLFNFVMRVEKVEFREALEMLADRAGIQLLRGRGLPGHDKAALWRTLGWAAERYRTCLTSAPEAVAARGYLTERGLAPDVLERFGVGFAPSGWDWLLRQAATAGIATSDLVGAGLVVERQDRSGFYDRFRGRVMFPIRDAQGRCIAFGGRVLPGDADPAKYVNSPETMMFSKSGTLYGLDSARAAMTESRRAIVVEGYTDCLAARQAGVDDVVAVLGTALGERHVRLLRRYADRIVLVLDGDEAGRRRADEVLEVLLAEPVDVRIARLPSGTDPCDFLLANGRAAFEELIAAASDPLDYRMDELLTRLPANAGDASVLAAVESVLGALVAAGRSGTARSSGDRAYGPLREDQVLGRLARRFGLSRDSLRDRVRQLRARTPVPDRDPAPAEGESPRLPAWDREVIEVLVGVPGSVGLIVRQVGGAGLDSQPGRAVLEAAERLHASGRDVALSSLLLEITDPTLQSLLVAVDEANAARAIDPGERLSHLEEALRRREAERRAMASARQLLTAERLDSESQAELLERLVAERRAAQGMTDPKDG